LSGAEVDILLGVILKSASREAGLCRHCTVFVGDRDVNGDWLELTGGDVGFGVIPCIGYDLQGFFRSTRGVCEGSTVAFFASACSAISIIGAS